MTNDFIKEDGIIMARGESTTYSINLLEESGEPQQDPIVPLTEVTAGSTDSFRSIIDRVKDDEAVEITCRSLEIDIVDETRELTSGLVVILDEADMLEHLVEPLGLTLEYFLNEDNDIVFNVTTNVEYLIDQMEGKVDDVAREIINIQIDGVIKAYCLYYGHNTRSKWEELINFAFNDPDMFKNFAKDVLNEA